MTRTLLRVASYLCTAGIVLAQAACTTKPESEDTYRLGGLVSGLVGTVVLQNNGGDDLSVAASGPFVFATALAEGAGYDVTVRAQPVGQTCTVDRGTGRMGNSNVNDVLVTCTTDTYALGGSMTGLLGTLVLQNQGTDDLEVSADGSFVFETPMSYGAEYAVSILRQPEGQTCVVAEGSGVMPAADVSEVVVTCTSHAFLVGGTVSGLTGTLVLGLGAEELTVTANGPFSFPTTVLHGEAYEVRIAVRPAGQGCEVTGGAGTVAAADVTSVMVVCWSARYGTDGKVNAIARGPDGTIYLGGSFTQVSRVTGGGAAFDVAAGKPDLRFPTFGHDAAGAGGYGTIMAAAPDGNGGLYVGGAFSHVGGVARRNLVHLLADFSVDPNWDPSPDASVRALAVSDTVVYAGGTFENVGGQQRRFIAAIDASGAVTGWNPWANNFVFALAASGSTVYAGGQFTNIGGQARARIAALDATLDTSNATAWDPGADSPVQALVVANDRVYVAGNFSTIGGAARTGVAVLDTTKDTANATAWDPGVVEGGGIYGLAVGGPTLYVAGTFTRVAGEERLRLASFDLTADVGNLTGWNPAADKGAYAVAVIGDTVYVAGMFGNLGSTPHAYLAAVDATSGEPTEWEPGLGHGTDPNIGADKLTVVGDTLVVGGWFTGVDRKARARLAALDPATGAPTDWNPGAAAPDGTDEVKALVVFEGVVYAGGSFTEVGGAQRNRIAAIDAVTGDVLPWAPFMDGDVGALAVGDGVVYAGGSFTNVVLPGPTNLARAGLVALDAATGAPTTWDPGLEYQSTTGQVWTLLLSGSTLYAAGLIDRVRGEDRKGAVAFDVMSGQMTPWAPIPLTSPDSRGPHALALHGDLVLLGGNFTQVNGGARAGLAAVDRLTGVATAWAPRVFGTVNVLAPVGNTVYAAGDFLTVAGLERLNLAALDASSGTPSAWDPRASHSVFALVTHPTGLSVGGRFDFLANAPAGGYAELNQ